MNEIRYCLYIRKSSEQDERQAMSLESQRKEMEKLQKSEGLNVVKIIEESKSAKESFSRPGFTQLMAGLMDGEYEGILTWAVDRLSRNAGDLGLLVDLMDQEKLQVVRTHDSTFLGSNPNEKFLLMLLGSQAKLENDNRGKNVKRGMRAACSQGRRPYKTPIGYRMTPGEEIQDHNRVVIDEKWAPFVQDVFNMVGERGISVYQVWKKLGKCGQLTKNGKPFPKSSLQHILAETFYYGDFEYPKKSGNWYKGKHEAIITKKIYDKVQENIAKRRPKQPRRKWGEVPFKFNRIFKCGECGSGINGIFRQNRHHRLYLYYKCNKASSTIKCKQSYIRGQALAEQIGSIAKKITEADIGKLNERQKEDVDRYSRIMNEFIHPYWLIKTELMNGDLREKADALRTLKGKLLITDKKMIYEPIT